MKALTSILAAASFVMMFATTDTILGQVILSLSAMAVFALSCKLAERYCLTKEEKEERV